MAFSARVLGAEGSLAIELSGEADSAVVPELELAFEQADDGESPVVVDLAEVTFIDSRVMSLLESWLVRLREQSRQMPVVKARDEVMRLFRLIGLDREFEFYDDRASALAG